MSKITKEEYQKMLDNHDWYYELSDDMTVYRAGKQSLSELIRIAFEDEELLAMYFKKKATIKL